MATHREPSLENAKARLDSIIAKARVDLYKPIQIAEVLYHSRLGDSEVDVTDLETYRRQSIHWRNLVSTRILGKISTSSAKFQDNIWEANAMPPELLIRLNEENKRTAGAVEKYIYLKFQERQQAVANIITFIEDTTPEIFKVGDLFDIFEINVAVRRSIDKVYEVVVYSLLECIVTTLRARVTVSIPDEQKYLLPEFSDLTSLLLGISETQSETVLDAHIYRAGVTNAVLIEG